MRSRERYEANKAASEARRNSQKDAAEKGKQEIALKHFWLHIRQDGRAWLAPVNMQLKTPLDQGPPLTVRILYFNTGKQPALGFKYNGIGSVINTPNNWRDWAAMELPENATCNGIIPDDGGPVVYPSIPGFAGEIEYDMAINIRPGTGLTAKDAIKQIIAGSSTFVINGCLVYKTVSSIKRSAFCFFFGNDIDSPMRDWKFKECRTGNWAE